MIILSIRTDKPEAEVGLFHDQNQIDYEVWHADRELSLTILEKITRLLERNDTSMSMLEGIVVFEGPGSFTGLRIGLSVANSLAYGLRVPVVASNQEAWIQDGIERLKQGESSTIALPNYGREPHITRPKK